MSNNNNDNDDNDDNDNDKLENNLELLFQTGNNDNNKLKNNLELPFDIKNSKLGGSSLESGGFNTCHLRNLSSIKNIHGWKAPYQLDILKVYLCPKNNPGVKIKAAIFRINKSVNGCNWLIYIPRVGANYVSNFPSNRCIGFTANPNPYSFYVGHSPYNRKPVLQSYNIEFPSIYMQAYNHNINNISPYGDRFRIESRHHHSGMAFTIIRTDANEGWGMNLHFRATEYVIRGDKVYNQAYSDNDYFFNFSLNRDHSNNHHWFHRCTWSIRCSRRVNNKTFYLGHGSNNFTAEIKPYLWSIQVLDDQGALTQDKAYCPGEWRVKATPVKYRHRIWNMQNGHTPCTSQGWTGSGYPYYIKPKRFTTQDIYAVNQAKKHCFDSNDPFLKTIPELIKKQVLEDPSCQNRNYSGFSFQNQKCDHIYIPPTSNGDNINGNCLRNKDYVKSMSFGSLMRTKLNAIADTFNSNRNRDIQNTPVPSIGRNVPEIIKEFRGVENGRQWFEFNKSVLEKDFKIHKQFEAKLYIWTNSKTGNTLYYPDPYKLAPYYGHSPQKVGKGGYWSEVYNGKKFFNKKTIKIYVDWNNKYGKLSSLSNVSAYIKLSDLTINKLDPIRVSQNEVNQITKNSGHITKDKFKRIYGIQIITQNENCPPGQIIGLNPNKEEKCITCPNEFGKKVYYTERTNNITSAQVQGQYTYKNLEYLPNGFTEILHKKNNQITTNNKCIPQPTLICNPGEKLNITNTEIHKCIPVKDKKYNPNYIKYDKNTGKTTVIQYGGKENILSYDIKELFMKDINKLQIYIPNVYINKNKNFRYYNIIMSMYLNNIISIKNTKNIIKNIRTIYETYKLEYEKERKEIQLAVNAVKKYYNSTNVSFGYISRISCKYSTNDNIFTIGNEKKTPQEYFKLFNDRIKPPVTIEEKQNYDIIFKNNENSIMEYFGLPNKDLIAKQGEIFVFDKYLHIKKIMYEKNIDNKYIPNNNLIKTIKSNYIRKYIPYNIKLLNNTDFTLYKSFIENINYNIHWTINLTPNRTFMSFREHQIFNIDSTYIIHGIKINNYNGSIKLGFIHEDSYDNINKTLKLNHSIIYIYNTKNNSYIFDNANDINFTQLNIKYIVLIFDKNSITKDFIPNVNIKIQYERFYYSRKQPENINNTNWIETNRYDFFTKYNYQFSYHKSFKKQFLKYKFLINYIKNPSKIWTQILNNEDSLCKWMINNINIKNNNEINITELDNYINSNLKSKYKKKINDLLKNSINIDNPEGNILMPCNINSYIKNNKCVPKTSQCPYYSYLKLSNNSQKNNECIDGFDYNIYENTNIAKTKKYPLPLERYYSAYNKWVDSPFLFKRPSLYNFYLKKNEKIYNEWLKDNKNNNIEILKINGHKNIEFTPLSIKLKDSTHICPMIISKYNNESINKQTDINKKEAIFNITQKNDIITINRTDICYDNITKKDIICNKIDFELIIYCNNAPKTINTYETKHTKTLKCDKGTFFNDNSEKKVPLNTTINGNKYAYDEYYFLKNNTCSPCDINSFNDINNHNFKKCISKQICPNDYEYYYISKNSKENNICIPCEYFTFRKQTDNNKLGQYVKNIDNIIFTLANIICFWNLKSTYFYLKDEFNISDININDISNLTLINQLKNINNPEKKYKWMLLKLYIIINIWNLPKTILNIKLPNINQTEYNRYINISNNTYISLYNSYYNRFICVKNNKIVFSDKIDIINYNTEPLKTNIDDYKFYREHILTTPYLNIGTELIPKRFGSVSLFKLIYKKNTKDESMIYIKDNKLILIKNTDIKDKIYDLFYFMEFSTKKYILMTTKSKYIKNFYKNFSPKMLKNVMSYFITYDDTNNNNIPKLENLENLQNTDRKSDIQKYNFNILIHKNNTIFESNIKTPHLDKPILPIINFSNYDIFYKNIDKIDYKLKYYFNLIYILYFIYFKMGCNNDKLINFDLSNNFDKITYKNTIKNNIRTLKIIKNIFNITNTTNILSIEEKYNDFYKKSIEDQYYKTNQNFTINMNKINIKKFENYSKTLKQRLILSLTSINGIININTKNDNNLFKNTSNNLPILDENTNIFTLNNRRYIKCMKITKSELTNIKNIYLNNIFNDTNNSINTNNYYNNLLKITEEINKIKNFNYKKEITRKKQINNFFNLLYKGCKSPYNELTNYNNKQLILDINTQNSIDNILDSNKYKNLINNDIKLIEDNKINTKEKCYNFILNDTKGVDLCCNSTDCIPDCNNINNRKKIEILPTDTTYIINEKYKKLKNTIDYNIKLNTQILNDKLKLTQLGCYKNLGTPNNYLDLINVNKNEKNPNIPDLNDKEFYGKTIQDLDNNISKRNNKLKTFVKDIVNKMDKVDLNYGKSKLLDENIDSCLPRIIRPSDNSYSYDIIYNDISLDNTQKGGNETISKDKSSEKKSTNIDTKSNISLNTSTQQNQQSNLSPPTSPTQKEQSNLSPPTSPTQKEQSNLSTSSNVDSEQSNLSPPTSPIQNKSSLKNLFKIYHNNIQNNLKNIEKKQLSNVNNINQLNSIGCYNDSPYREYIVNKHYNKLNCDSKLNINNNCIINTYNPTNNLEQNLKKSNEPIYQKTYELCRGDTINNINNVKYHIYFREKYINTINKINEKRTLIVLQILYSKLKSYDDLKIYNLFLKSSEYNISIESNLENIVNIFLDIIILSEIKYWGNLFKIFIIKNKKQYGDKNHKKLLLLIYKKLKFKINILEFLHCCSFMLKININIFGDKYINEYKKIKKELKYDTNIWKNMRKTEFENYYKNQKELL